MNIILGTRGSKLALAQSYLVKSAIESSNLGYTVEIVEISTLGDRKQGTKLASQSDKKDWVHDLERALIDGTIDMAVHCGKDIPVDIESGTQLLPILQRANPFDAFVGKRKSPEGARIKFSELPVGAKVGTASLRRRAHLLRLRPDLQVVEHRGNVPTRIQKMQDSEDMLGVVLACAGMDRLQLENVSYEKFSLSQMIPAINQGILVTQIRADDSALYTTLQKFSDHDTYDAWCAERAVAEILEGDCKSAMSIFAQCEGDMITLTSAVMSPDGKDFLEVTEKKQRAHARVLGLEVGENLIAIGADKIIEEARNFKY